MNATVEAPKPIVSQPFPAESRPAGKRPNWLRWLLIAVLGGAGLVWAGRFAWHAFLYEHTDDAYLNGHIHQISPQIDGTVAEVLVADNQQVKAGDVLVRLDPLQYQIALQKAQDGVVEAKAQAAHARAEVELAEAAISEAAARTAQAEAQVRQSSAQLDLARQNDVRNQQVYQNNHGAISKSEIDTTHGILQAREADLEAVKANLEAAKTAEISARCARDSAKAQEGAAQAGVESAQAQVREARRQLDRATIVAPADGRIGNKNVETGNRVQAGETLFALVEPQIWVVANFKETQLPKMHPGQAVEIEIDALPGEVFHGTVDSVAPASGAEFALLPADNATGNFTKVVQRVPVKITLGPADQARLAGKLRPGLSVVVNVRVR